MKTYLIFNTILGILFITALGWFSMLMDKKPELPTFIITITVIMALYIINRKMNYRKKSECL
jgi:hypothetical protein